MESCLYFCILVCVYYIYCLVFCVSSNCMMCMLPSGAINDIGLIIATQCGCKIYYYHILFFVDMDHTRLLQ